MGRAIGIDLGTTNSCIAVLQGGDPEIIPNAEGARTTPSVISFDGKGTEYVGAPAKRQALSNPDLTVSSVKRLIGRNVAEIKGMTFRQRVAAAADGSVRIVLGAKLVSPEQVSSRILAKIRRDAESALGEEVTDLVVTVPAYFNNVQREATKVSAELAGFNVLRIINEPTAAALAYGLRDDEDQTVLVFDLGGGTFDVSVLDIGDGVFDVRATAGDNFLGGDDFDARIAEWVLQSFEEQTGIELRGNLVAMQRIFDAAEKAKIELSGVEETTITLPFLAANDTGPLHFEQSLSRKEFEGLVTDLLDRLIVPMLRAIDDARVTPEQLDQVLLVGGMTRMPAVRTRVETTLGRRANTDVNPEEVVALGAAIQSGIIRGDLGDILLLDVTPLSLGIETKGGFFTKLIERNTTIPVRYSDLFTTTVDNQDHVDIHVLQGESALSAFNKSLGNFHLGEIPSAHRGEPQIEVTFDIDASGIIKVSAIDKLTNNAKQITIQDGAGLSKEEVSKLLENAVAHEERANALKDRQLARDEAELIIKAINRAIESHYGLFLGEIGVKIELTLQELQDALDTDALPRIIRERTDAIATVMLELSHELEERHISSEQFQIIQDPGDQADEISTQAGDNETSDEAEDLVAAEVIEIEEGYDPLADLFSDRREMSARTVENEDEAEIS